MRLDRENSHLDGFPWISTLEIHLNTRINHESILSYPSTILLSSFISCLHHVWIEISSCVGSLLSIALFLLSSLSLTFHSSILILMKWKLDMTCLLMFSLCFESLFHVVILFSWWYHLMFSFFSLNIQISLLVITFLLLFFLNVDLVDDFSLPPSVSWCLDPISTLFLVSFSFLHDVGAPSLTWYKWMW